MRSEKRLSNFFPSNQVDVQEAVNEHDESNAQMVGMNAIVEMQKHFTFSSSLNFASQIK